MYTRDWDKALFCSAKNFLRSEAEFYLKSDAITHGLRTPNEGINRRYLKNWADVVDRICFGRTFGNSKFGSGSAVKVISTLGVRSPCHYTCKKSLDCHSFYKMKDQPMTMVKILRVET